MQVRITRASWVCTERVRREPVMKQILEKYTEYLNPYCVALTTPRTPFTRVNVNYQHSQTRYSHKAPTVSPEIYEVQRTFDPTRYDDYVSE
jgi:hypothetical protein